MAKAIKGKAEVGPVCPVTVEGFSTWQVWISDEGQWTYEDEHNTKRRAEQERRECAKRYGCHTALVHIQIPGIAAK